MAARPFAWRDAKDAAKGCRHVSVACKTGRGGNLRQVCAGAAARGSFDQRTRSCDPPLYQCGMQCRAGCRPKRAGEVAFGEADISCKIRKTNIFRQSSFKMIENPLQASRGHATFSPCSTGVGIEQG